MIVVAVLALGGGDGGGSGAQAAGVFPSGGSFPKQTLIDVSRPRPRRAAS